jgi:hypothetical protein
MVRGAHPQPVRAHVMDVGAQVCSDDKDGERVPNEHKGGAIAGAMQRVGASACAAS